MLPALLLAAAAILFHRQVLFNPAIGMPWDLRGFHLPLATAYADALREGVWPLWEPYAYCGRPLLANPQTAVFYPGVFAAVVFGRDGLLYRLEVLEVLHVFLAGLFTYLLARRVGLGRAPALLAGLIFELGGFLASQVEHLSTICGAPWFVLAWLALFLPARWRIPALATALTLHFFLGFTGYTVMVGASTLLLAFALWIFRRASAALMLSVPLAGLLAAGLAAVQLLPSLELVRHSIGPYRAEWLKGGGGLPPAALVSLVSPNHSGIFDLRAYRGPHDPTMLYLYGSLAGLALAILALVRLAGYARVFAAMAGVCGILMLGDATPAGRLLFALFPSFLKSTFYWYLFMAPFLLSLALLAGYGAETWLRGRWMWVACAVAAIDMILAGSGRPMNTQRIADEPYDTAGAIDGSRETFAQLAAATATGRFDTADDRLSVVAGAPVLRLRAGNGYDPLALERLIQARLAFARGEPWGAYYQVEDPASPAVDALGIRALLVQDGATSNRIPGKPWQACAHVPGRTIYCNPAAPPRYRIVGRVRRAAGLAESAALLRGRDLHPAEEAIAEGFQLDSGARGAVEILSESRQHISLESDATAPAYLATSEPHYPGWTATVDGHPAPIYYTNVAFRGVPVPAGRHRVEFSFGAPALRQGAVVTGAALGILLLLLC